MCLIVSSSSQIVVLLSVNLCVDLPPSLLRTETVSRLIGGSGQQMFLQQPNIYHYMPHLTKHPDSLLPNVAEGQGRHGGMDINTHIKSQTTLLLHCCIKPLYFSFI